jgi:Domain of unknown function (DUF397)
VAGEELTWMKASRSIASGACIQIAADDDLVALRDSKEPEIVLRFTRAEFAAFVDGAIHGEFNQFLE